MKISPVSVTELNKYVKDKFLEDENLENVLVSGEISNFKHHYTGHFYFTLKDENSLIKCVMFKTYADHIKFEPKDGMKVIVFGSVSVFERDGIYQIYCKSIEEDGLGNLYLEYEKLKEKLEKAGLFSELHKKKIPYMPETIGVLTSNTGAVIRDIINVSTRRNPNVHLRLFPVPVQGSGAAEKIARAIEIMNEKELADVIIIARGGGSLEDLWPFNEEVLAWAIYNSKIPIISAVGHETDFTISDFVSDLRAPTPSAAAELAVVDIEDLKYTLNLYNRRLKMALKSKLDFIKLKFEKMMSSRCFKDPLGRINENYLKLDKYLISMNNSMNLKINNSKLKMEKNVSKLDALSPLKTLLRGYSIATNNKNENIKNINQVVIGDDINIMITDGLIKSKVIDIKEEK